MSEQIRKKYMSDIIRKLISGERKTGDLLKQSLVFSRKGDGEVKADRNITIYTDASTKIDGKTKDNKGFSGIGFVVKNDTSNEVTYRSGYKYNSNSTESELDAILHALKYINKQTNVHIVSDSKTALYLLENANHLIRRIDNEGFHSVMQELNKGRSRERQFTKDSFANYVQRLRKIDDVLTKNQNIQNLSISWVKAHLIDDELSKRNSGDMFELVYDKSEISKMGVRAEKLAEAIYGNMFADKKADVGVYKGIMKSADILLNPNKPVGKNFKANLIKNIYASKACMARFKHCIVNNGLHKFDSKRIIEILNERDYENLKKADQVFNETKRLVKKSYHETGIDGKQELDKKIGEKLKEYLDLLNLRQDLFYAEVADFYNREDQSLVIEGYANVNINRLIGSKEFNVIPFGVRAFSPVADIEMKAKREFEIENKDSNTPNEPKLSSPEAGM